MKKIVLAAALALFSTSAMAQSSIFNATYPLANYQPGFRSVNGSQLNAMVGEVNNLTGSGGAPVAKPLYGSTLTINSSTGPVALSSLPAFTKSGTLAIGSFVGPNSIDPRVFIDAFAGIPTFSLRRADGTIATPTAVQSTEELSSVNAWGYGATTYGTVPSGRFSFYATENYSDTAHGSRFSVGLAANTTTTVVERFNIGNDGAATHTSAAAASLAVGPNGATTPVFQVDSSTGSAVAGLKLTGAATGGTVALVTTDSGSNNNLTINALGTGTIGIGSVSTGRVTVTPVTTITGALTTTAAQIPTGGIGPAGGFTASPRNFWSCGVSYNGATSAFTAQTPVNTEVYITEVFIPANVTVTGVTMFNSATISGNVKVGLANSSGVNVATSASTAQSGTSTIQLVPFTGTYAAVGPATYYIETFFDNGTTRPWALTLGSCGAAKQTGQTYATGFTTVTPPTTFTTALGTVAALY